MSANDDSEIVYSEGGAITLAGPDAVNLFRAATIASGLGLYAKTGMKPNRAWTPTAMLKAAGEYTGKVYKRGQYAAAQADLKIWIDTMKAALPVTDNRTAEGVARRGR